MADAIDVTDFELQSLTQSILTRYGIDFTCYEPKSLKRRIIRVINNFELESVHNLWVKFLRDPKFVFTFMNEISVGMTSMFRDPILWKNIKSLLRNEFNQKANIDIWHAGCSTGEEVFTMGIVLKEVNLIHKVKAVATDFNQDAIATAQSGIYHKIKMIENENNYKQFNAFSDFAQYYTRESSDCKMDLSLTSHSKYSYQNLITDLPPSPGMFDIIFCRNVMIYFDSKAKENLLEKFYNALKPKGLFIIGFFDTMGHLNDSNKFNLINEEAKIFRKLE